MVFLNPAYGERLGDVEALAPLYRRIGSFFKGLTDYRGAVLTASPRLAREIGLRAGKQFPFYNGPLECRLLVFYKT